MFGGSILVVMNTFLSKKGWILFFLIAILFFALRLPGLHIPYHQDEYKWPQYANPALTEPGAVPHPPLTEFIYRVIGHEVGYNNFRFIPLVFSTINLFLIFYLSKSIFGTSDRFDKLAAGKLEVSKIALWSTFLFAVSFYSVLASLMVDVDGAVMPFFFLILSIGYFELKKRNFQFSIFNFTILLIGAIGGILIKISGVLPVVALTLDFALIKGFFSDKKRFLKFILLGLGLAVSVVAVLLLAKLLFPFFPIEKSIDYWKHFANSSSFFNRGWLQTFIQFTKALMYLSPLLLLLVVFTDKEIFKKLRPLFFFIFIGLTFYLFAFDFSLGALDRYFEFLIIPLCVISGTVLSRLKIEDLKLNNLIWPVLLSLVIFSFQFFNHFVPSHYPKTEWLERVISLKWNFLFPFSGGSGPIGFYVSFAFIGIIWLCSVIFVTFTLKKEKLKNGALVAIFVLGLVYNGAFIEEYLFGLINGNPTRLFKEAKKEIVENSNIRQVLVYNDIGGFEIKQTNKYFRRMYAAPQFESEYQKIFHEFGGHLLFIDIPRIAEGSVYVKYMRDYCNPIFQNNDKYITAQVLKCDPMK